MNYRHAFHAGNFADCVKHALIVWMLRALMRKPAPIHVLDTHAGAGRYSLDAEPAQRTGEWRNGIGRLTGDGQPLALEPLAPESLVLEPLADYLGLVRAIGLYPGSPALIRAMLRPGDHLTCCELHPEDTAALRRMFARDPQVSVHHRDAWEALRGLLPPREKRGLVLVDPPDEAPDEFARIVAGLAEAHARFPAGVLVAWYPVKHLAPVREFHMAMLASGIRDVVTAEFLLREPLDASRLNGCGLLVVNPPYPFEREIPLLLDALRHALTQNEPGSSSAVSRLADE